MATEQEGDGGHQYAEHKPDQRSVREWLEIATVALLLATALGTFGAAYFAYRQWITADDAEVRGLRAYVLVKSIPLHPDADVRVEIENSGQTPADNIRIFTNWAAVPRGGSAAFCAAASFPEQHQCESGDGKSTSVLAAKGSIISGNVACARLRPDAERAVRNEIDWILYGRVTYDDVFRRGLRQSTFCYRISPEGAQLCDCHNEAEER